jgi:hypothetical protein
MLKLELNLQNTVIWYVMDLGPNLDIGNENAARIRTCTVL